MKDVLLILGSPSVCMEFMQKCVKQILQSSLSDSWYKSYYIFFFSVMSFPAEGVESAIKHHIDNVKTYLESRHRNSYAVYNLSQKTYRPAKFENRVGVIKTAMQSTTCLRKHMSQCMSKGGLWPDVILVRKEHCGVTAVYFSICTKHSSFGQW